MDGGGSGGIYTALYKPIATTSKKGGARALLDGEARDVISANGR